MKCYVHPDLAAVASCISCGSLICQGCDVVLAGKHYCKRCLAQAEPVASAPVAGVPAAAGSQRRLTRSVHDRWLAGVLGGLARYFDTDPVIVRILFVVLMLATAIIPCTVGYLIFALVVPNDLSGN